MAYRNGNLIKEVVTIALTNLTIRLKISLILLATLCTVAAGKIIYVDDDATGTNNGSSWENAYFYLQDALADANSAEKPVEILVAQGIYKPDQGAYQTPGDREATFRLINGVTLIGGYAGLGEPDPNARDVELYETILSGDLNGDDVQVDIVEVADLKNLDSEPTRMENSYHVVTGNGTDDSAVLDGFRVTGANANGPRLGDEIPYDYRLRRGGGMYNFNGNPTVNNCTFTRNSADSYGGGIYNENNSNPILTSCVFTENSANMNGGAMSNDKSRPTLTNCVFSRNSASGGGGMDNRDNSNSTLNKCIFSGNSADYGGGMYNDLGSSPSLTECIFSGNSANTGGGMYNLSDSNPTLANCTFSDNSAGLGGGGMNNSQSSPILTQCIFNGNSADYGGGMSNFDGSSPTLTNCIFRGNMADLYGGGMDNASSSSPSLTKCIFIGNSANTGGGIYSLENSTNMAKCTFSGNSAKEGGGLCNFYNNGTTLNSCTFSGNSANTGGGMYNHKSSLSMTKCVFDGNLAQEGGGMYNFYSSSPALIDCTFSGNSADTGGGIYNNYKGSPTLARCTFSGNSSVLGGGGMYNSQNGPTLSNCTFSENSTGDNSGVIYNDHKSSLILTNCILWDGGNEISNSVNSTITISYSNIQGGWHGEGNIDADPLFAELGYWVDVNDSNIIVEPNDPNALWVHGDYHLKSEAGRWDPNSENWIKDDVTSPCIDAGDPNSDFSGETWPHGERINMGAYGGTRQASMSLKTEGMTLARVAYIFSHKDEAAESFQSLLGAYGCPTTLIRLNDMTATALDSYDLLIVANDTQHEDTWSDPNTVAAIEDSGKPIVGLGDGGYDFFGLLGLSIGYPNGGHGSRNSIEVIDPNSSLFSTPYSIDIPEDRVLQLYTETNHVGLYLWPTIPETVTALGREVDSVNYFPLAMEHNRYLLWGFTESPQMMTEVGKTLFINVVIHTANEAWESNT